MKYWIGGLTIVVLLMGVVLVRDALSPDIPTYSPFPRATALPVAEPFWGKVKDFAPVGARVLEVKVRLLNTGNQPSVGECDLIAYDKKGAVASYPVSTPDAATPGFGVPVTQRIRLKQPADTIERFEVDC